MGCWPRANISPSQRGSGIVKVKGNMPTSVGRIVKGVADLSERGGTLGFSACVKQVSQCEAQG